MASFNQVRKVVSLQSLRAGPVSTPKPVSHPCGVMEDLPQDFKYLLIWVVSGPIGCPDRFRVYANHGDDDFLLLGQLNATKCSEIHAELVTHFGQKLADETSIPAF